MSEWTVETLKEYVDTRLEAGRDAIRVATLAIDARLELLNEFRAQSAEKDVNFARVEELKEVKRQLGLIVGDHVNRRDFEALRDDQVAGRGRRTAYAATIGIVVTIVVVLFGFIARAGITHSDVSQQIQNEAPWNKDKPAYTQRIVSLERQVHDSQVSIARLQALLLNGRK